MPVIKFPHTLQVTATPIRVLYNVCGKLNALDMLVYFVLSLSLDVDGVVCGGLGCA